MVELDCVNDAELVDGDPGAFGEPLPPATGARALLTTGLVVALAEARRGDPDARAWIASDATVSQHSRFRFLAAGEHLGLEPGVVRAQLAGMRVNDHGQAVAA